MKHTSWMWICIPSCCCLAGRFVRLKVWESLPDNEPPREVKNLLKKVFLEGKGENVVAWLCYPSSTIVRGNIITPCSKYDYRLKLRGGKRHAKVSVVRRKILILHMLSYYKVILNAVVSPSQKNRLHILSLPGHWKRNMYFDILVLVFSTSKSTEF